MSPNKLRTLLLIVWIWNTIGIRMPYETTSTKIVIARNIIKIVW